MKNIFVGFAIILTLVACNSAEKPVESIDADYMVDLPGDFAVFYKTFHEDSLFQINRIMWPLQGLLQTDAQGNTTKYYHPKETWLMHRRMTKDTGFSGSMKYLGDDLIQETLVDGNGQFGMQRRFAKFGEEWYLIFYSGLNHISQADKVDFNYEVTTE